MSQTHVLHLIPWLAIELAVKYSLFPLSIRAFWFKLLRFSASLQARPTPRRTLLGFPLTGILGLHTMRTDMGCIKLVALDIRYLGGVLDILMGLEPAE